MVGWVDLMGRYSFNCTGNSDYHSHRHPPHHNRNYHIYHYHNRHLCNNCYRLNGIYVSGLDKLNVTHIDGFASFIDPQTIKVVGADKEKETILRGLCLCIAIDLLPSHHVALYPLTSSSS